MTIGLGIDTGGTYTDSVILDMDSGRILSRAKDLTTRNDLVIGITGSIGKHRPELLKKISLVSLSSTLATNSVVEGKGCRAGLISIGRRYDGTVTADVYAQVAGSHDLKGNEKVPLDEEAAKAALSEMKGKGCHSHNRLSEYQESGTRGAPGTSGRRDIGRTGRPGT